LPMSGPECQWGDCDNEATRKVWFTSPAESVNYCDGCVVEVKRQTDWESIRTI